MKIDYIDLDSEEVSEVIKNKSIAELKNLTFEDCDFDDVKLDLKILAYAREEIVILQGANISKADFGQPSYRDSTAVNKFDKDLFNLRMEVRKEVNK